MVTKVSRALDALLEECTLKVWSQNKTAVGTGFFFAPQRIVTCAHVISERTANSQIFDVEWKSQNFKAKLLKLFPDPCPKSDIFPDIAVLEVSIESHPFVHFGKDFLKGDDLSSWGYSKESSGGESIAGVCEGITKYLGKDPGKHLIKFKETQVKPGISGAPLLNLRTNRVCGMIKRTRNRKSNLGGQAIRGELLLENLKSFMAGVAIQKECEQRWTEAKNQIDPDTFSDDSPETKAIRIATAEDCYEIIFLAGKRGMDQGFFRKLIIRGRGPSDQMEAAQAVEYLIKETLRDRQSGLPSGYGLKNRTAESDLGESWPKISLDDRIKEKCESDFKGLRALLLTDEPGGGKSTTVRNLAWRIAKRDPPFEDEVRQPVYIRLRDWESSIYSARDLADYLQHLHSKISDWPQTSFWQQALGRGTKNGKLFLVFDGLDELSSSRTFAGDLLDEIEKWAYSGNVVLITCRTRSLGAYKSKLSNFDILRINGLDTSETNKFISDYPKLTEPSHLINELKRQPYMRQLARDPFLLDVICYLAADDHGHLPKSRSHLIERALEKLLLEDITHFDWPNGIAPSINTLLQTLAITSFFLCLREAHDQTHNIFSHEDFETALKHAVFFEPSAKEVSISILIEFYSSTRFLQIPSQQRISKEKIGSFNHGLFLDFLAAVGFAYIIESNTTGDRWGTRIDSLPGPDKSPEDIIKSRAYDLAWFELLSFLPSRLKEPKPFFRILCCLPDDISRRQAALVMRAMSELSASTLSDPSMNTWIEPLAQSCWDIAVFHWRLGITKLVEGLIAEISSIARIHPGLMDKLIEEVRSNRLQSRLDALASLDKIGMAAVHINPLIQELARSLSDRNWTVRKLASAALAKIGPSAAKEIIVQMEQSTRWYEQASACKALGLMESMSLSEAGIDVIGPILKLLTQKQPALLRANACEALGNLGPNQRHSNQVLEKLAEQAVLSVNDPTVRAQACTALGKFGSRSANSSIVLSALIERIGDDDWVVRSSASTALGSLARESNIDRLKFVIDLEKYSHSAPHVKATICQTLGRLQSVFSAHPKEVQDLLNVFLNDEDADVCKCASEAIQKLGINVSNIHVLKRLMNFLENSDWQKRTCAIEGLTNLINSFTPNEKFILQGLLINLENSEWYVRASSCEVLGKMGSHFPEFHEPILNAITQLLKSSNRFPRGEQEYVEVKAIRALGKLGFHKSAIKLINQFLASENWQIQVSACAALQEIAGGASQVEGTMAGVVECLSSNIWCVRASACRTIGRLTDSVLIKEEELTRLVTCIFDTQQPVRAEAADAITRLIGSGNLSMTFLLDSEQKIISVWQGENKIAQISFSKAPPHLLMLNLIPPAKDHVGDKKNQGLIAR